MSRKCELSGRKTTYGGNRKHKRGSSGSGGVWRFKSHRTSRTWRPNLRRAKLTDTKTGVTKSYRIAMKAYKKLRKSGSYKGFTLVTYKTGS